jgi:hypothetical protein
MIALRAVFIVLSLISVLSFLNNFLAFSASASADSTTNPPSST